MSAVWPIDLPQDFMEDGLSVPFPDNTIRKTMDVGPAKLRRRDTSAASTITGSVMLTYDQYTIFETFFNTTLSSGSLPFDWHHPINRAITSCTFTKAPTATLTNGMIKVQMDLEMQI